MYDHHNQHHHQVYISTIFSSVLVIGKVGAENLLSADEQLKDKGFWEKLVLISFYIIYYIHMHLYHT